MRALIALYCFAIGLMLGICITLNMSQHSVKSGEYNLIPNEKYICAEVIE